LNMKTTLLLTASIAGFFSALAAETPTRQEQPPPLTAIEIAQTKAQELSRVLVQLKLQEVAIQRATPVDNDSLALIRAQQKAIDQDLLDIALAPLEFELKRASSSHRSGHPILVEIQERIKKTKTILSATH
ncbi:MAG: hypothetical protein M3463_14805, partial [Verrucomicrobiota bacterium]|nr:hypothetical protein [Verrucomicrobiota bacterium]